MFLFLLIQPLHEQGIHVYSDEPILDLVTFSFGKIHGHIENFLSPKWQSCARPSQSST